MPCGFPAYCEERARFDCDTGELMDAIDDAIAELGWSGSQVDRWRWKASTGMTFFSWGESITIEVERGGRVFVRSEYSFPLAWLDWGHNSSNVTRFLKRLDDLLGDRPPRRRRDD